MEHHSNQTSWLETIADVVVMEPDEQGFAQPAALERLLEDQRYKNRPLKIGSFTACSNVTGVRTPYRALARIMHERGGYCFVDFAASAPYSEITMRPADPLEKLDAIFFSPHKFLGGPGSPGVLVFDSALYHNSVPDNPGGGTVEWTNPWGEHRFVPDIEAREDGGTPAFLQTIKAALALKLKEQMTVSAIERRESELVRAAWKELKAVPNLRLLADNAEERLGALSFYIENVHYNLVVALLNDRFGVQVRGGCSCAGTYGHYLLHVDKERSHSITERIAAGDLSSKPGWVRLSLHPTMTDAELEHILGAVAEVAAKADDWSNDYVYSSKTNEYVHRSGGDSAAELLRGWFESPFER